jgi:hypothetical protein
VLVNDEGQSADRPDSRAAEPLQLREMKFPEALQEEDCHCTRDTASQTPANETHKPTLQSHVMDGALPLNKLSCRKLLLDSLLLDQLFPAYFFERAAFIDICAIRAAFSSGASRFL